jgi:hypothetical protein
MLKHVQEKHLLSNKTYLTHLLHVVPAARNGADCQLACCSIACVCCTSRLVAAESKVILANKSQVNLAVQETLMDAAMLGPDGLVSKLV